MRKVQFLLMCCLMLGCNILVQAQKVKTSKPQKQINFATIEREIKEFFDSYAEDLRASRREAIANRYDPRGVFFLGNGQKTFESFDQNKNFYLTKWTGPKSFEWKDLSIEVLSSDSAVVVGLFNWQTNTGETLTFSYTGLLIKHSGKWRIRLEDESSAPTKPTTQ